MKKRILIFALAIFTLLTLTSCGKKFTVTFNADGGTLAGEATVQVKKGKTISEPTAPTKEGYTFAGWYNGETKYDFSSKVTSDITLVARWSGQTEFKDPVTITFDSKGGSSVKTITVEKGSKATKPTNPTKSGYTFAGWYNGETLFDFNTAITANITLVAKWTEGTEITNPVTITFDSDGGSAVAPLTIQKGTIPTKPADPVKEGFVFDYWFEKGKLTKFNFGNKLQRNVELVAAWREYAIITLDLNLGKFEVLPEQEPVRLEYEVNYNGNIVIDNDATPTRNGFEFGGWMINGEVVDLTTYKVTADVTITAKWNQVEGNEYVTVTFDSNGGAVEFEPLVLLKGSVISNIDKYNPGKNAAGDKFDGWKLNDEYFGSTTVVDQNITLVASWDSGTQTTEYKPKWEPNKQTGGFDGKGMTVKILCLPTASFDPFDPGYSSSDKKIKQTHQRLVEKEYNISIVYGAWDDSASWGPDRVAYIKANAKGEFRANDVYIVNITSSWIPTLVKEECLAELYDIDTDTGIFTEVGYQEVSKGVYQAGTYQQAEAVNQATGSSGKVYGYVQGNIHPDNFMYFNENLISESGLENPAELWFKGEWTWSKFEEYTKQLQNYLNGKSTDTEKYYALALGYPEFWIGSCASTGNGIATVNGKAGRLNLKSPNVVERLSAIQSLVQSGSYDKSRGVADVAASFAQGKVAFHHGDLWFLKDPSRFDPTWTWKIGCVPYPTANNEGGEPQYTTDSSKAIKDANGNPLQDASGQYISGIDMTNSTFKVPYTTTSCYSVIDTGVSGGKNGINNKIVFAIMYDLFSGQGSDPKAAQVTDEQAYRNWLLTKIGKELYADVIMSVQECTYFELIDTLSMSVGGGSHFAGDGLWKTLPGVCTGTDSAQASLASIYDTYKKQFSDLGYVVA